LWSGNVPLHEWKETFEFNYSTGLYDLGTEHSPTTWIFEAGSFVPCGKIVNGKHYSIITDHLGTPIEAYNQEGELIWEREQDLYGNSRQGFAKENFRCPFKYQGQYYDPEIELCYNRFRYYHPETGRYISQDPIGLLSGEPNFFAYVSDTNAWLDLLGLELIFVNPNDINYSQRTVSEIRVFDPSKYEPINVINVDGQMVTYDNRRLLAAQNAGLNTLEINTVQADEPFPLSEKKKTWWDKFKERYKDDRNIAAGGIVLNSGKAWKSIDIQMDEGELKPTLTGNVGNKKTKTELEFLIPGLRTEVLGWIDAYKNAPCVFAVKDANGKLFVIGNKDLGARIDSAEGTTGKKIDDNSGVTVKLVANAKTCVYEGEITLEPAA